MDFQQLRADRQAVEQAARHLRDLAILDAYGGDGHEGKDRAFALALVLDELSRHLRRLPDDLRRRVVQVCEGFVSGRS